MTTRRHVSRFRTSAVRDDFIEGMRTWGVERPRAGADTQSPIPAATGRYFYPWGRFLTVALVVLVVVAAQNILEIIAGAGLMLLAMA